MLVSRSWGLIVIQFQSVALLLLRNIMIKWTCAERFTGAH